ncbi:MAG: MaoC family dehydratase [Chloroflexi bacterium]|nr:MaoC family dehydratase [Chloroflexota bacterium]
MTAEQAAPDLSYDESVIGVEVDAGDVEITREQIARYCEAVGETNPLYLDERAAAEGPHDGIIAPPGLLHTIQTQGWMDPKVKFGNTTFAAGSKMVVMHPVHAGDTINARVAISEVYAKTGRTGTMMFVVRRTTYRNQHGLDVATNDFSTVHRQVERVQ